MHSAPAPTTPTATAPHHPAATSCLNCHQPLQGAYCHHCGQAASTPKRITAHHLLHEIPHAIWHVDHGIFYNVRELLSRPGLSIQRYLSGERKKFFNPLSMLILVGGVSAFLFAKLHIELLGDPQPGISPRVALVQREMMTVIQQFQAWVAILFLPIEAAVATLMLRRNTRYNWAEQLVAAALMSGTVAVVNMVFIPALAYWSGQPQVAPITFLMTAVMVLYKTWGYAQLQAVQIPTSRPVARWARALLTSLAQYLAMMVMIIILMGIVAAVVLTKKA